jgi:hypothetical protein
LGRQRLRFRARVRPQFRRHERIFGGRGIQHMRDNRGVLTRRPLVPLLSRVGLLVFLDLDQLVVEDDIVVRAFALRA